MFNTGYSMSWRAGGRRAVDPAGLVALSRHGTSSGAASSAAGAAASSAAGAASGAAAASPAAAAPAAAPAADDAAIVVGRDLPWRELAEAADGLDDVREDERAAGPERRPVVCEERGLDEDGGVAGRRGEGHVRVDGAAAVDVRERRELERGLGRDAADDDGPVAARAPVVRAVEGRRGERDAVVAAALDGVLLRREGVVVGRRF